MVPTVAKAYTSAKGLDAIARHRVKNICLGLGISINLYLPLVLGGGASQCIQYMRIYIYIDEHCFIFLISPGVSMN